MVEIEMMMKPNLLDKILRKTSALLKPEVTLTAAQFQQLLNPYKDHLYNFIVKALYFSEDAQDVYQESVLRAFKYRQGFDQERRDSFKTWIFTIAYNEIKRYYNLHKEEQSREHHGVLLDQLPDVSRGNCQERRIIRTIYEIAQELLPNQQRVFFLFYDQHFTIKEIADITGLKEGNIKFILNQAREKIKSRLTQSEPRS